MSESIVVACPHCHAANRVPQARLGEQPVCGRCKELLFAGVPIELGIDAAARHMRADLPLLVDFWAPWCGPCNVMSPQFKAAARLLEPQMHLAKINTQNEPTLGQRYAIRAIPTMVLFRNERELARHSGVMPTRAIADWAREALARAA